MKHSLLQENWQDRSTDSSVGKESAYNAYNEGDLGSNLGLGRSLEKEKATNSSILAWRTPWIV